MTDADNTPETPAQPAGALEPVRVPMENLMHATSTFQGCGKLIHVDYLTNPVGHAIRITEMAAKKRNSIMIPTHLLDTLGHTILRVVKEGAKNHAEGKSIEKPSKKV